MDDFGNSILEFYPNVVLHFILCSDEEFDSIFDYHLDQFYGD